MQEYMNNYMDGRGEKVCILAMVGVIYNFFAELLEERVYCNNC